MTASPTHQPFLSPIPLTAGRRHGVDA